MALVLRVPTSKSYTQRALLLAALAPGRSVIRWPAPSDDAELLAAALAALGAPIDREGEQVAVHGGGALRAPETPVFLGNAGTAVRLTTALSLLVDGRLTIDGVEAMRRRPMTGLLSALRSLGVAVEELGRRGCPPVALRRPEAIPRRVDLDPAGSSQQLSALLLVAPRLPEGLVIRLTGSLPSRPYVEMTLDALRAFGGLGGWTDDSTLRVEPGGLRATDYEVEGDWSSAAMVLAGGWIRGVDVRVENLPETSSQGDRVFVEVLERLSAPGPRVIDLHDAPDLVPPTVAAALFAEGRTTIARIEHLRIKESDRIAVLAGELAKVGATIEQEEGSMTVVPGPLAGEAVLDPHGDHRMAMAFGLVGLRVPGLAVADEECVSKSFPSFWEILEELR